MRVSVFLLLLAAPAAVHAQTGCTPEHAAMGHCTMPTAPPAAGSATSDVNAADVRFMQEMIPHHGQALEMAALVDARSEHRGLRLLAERIAVSQRDEIRWMQAWLRRHGQSVPEASDGHGQHHLHMVGMLSPAQMADLEAARGDAFVRRWLSYMTQHHRGALLMVDTLFASPGATLRTEVYRIATDIDADQQMDIGRMAAMLATLPPDPTPLVPPTLPVPERRPLGTPAPSPSPGTGSVLSLIHI